jgi:hypothetical protein
MITVTSKEDQFLFRIKGIHQLWAFRRTISVLKPNVIRAYKDNEELYPYSGLRIPGTYIPYLITAGSFYKKGWNFWDVCNKENTIIVELKDEGCQKLYIEVENPEETLHLLNTK